MTHLLCGMACWFEKRLSSARAHVAKMLLLVFALIGFANASTGSAAPSDAGAHAATVGITTAPGARFAQNERTGQKPADTFDPLAGEVRERARLFDRDTARTALQALAASLGGGCVPRRAPRPGIAVFGFPVSGDVGLSSAEATAIKDEVKDAISRLDDLIVWVPFDDSAETLAALEAIRVTGNAQTQAEALKTLDTNLKSAVDYVIHFSKVAITSSEPSFQINVMARDGGCAQSRRALIAPERLVSGDLRAVIQDAAHEASRSGLISAMGSGDALVVLPPMVNGRVLSSLWADNFANDLARAVKMEALSRNQRLQPELVGTFGVMPSGVTLRYLWLQPRFDQQDGKIRFRLELFPTEGDPLTIHQQAVARMAVPPEAWASPILDILPARIPFMKQRPEYDFWVTSTSALSLFCYSILPSNSTTLLMPRLGRNGLDRVADIDSLNEAWRPSPPLDRKSLYDLADHSFRLKQPEVRVDLIECVGVPALSPGSREALTTLTRAWLKMAHRKGVNPAADEVRALFTNLPFYHHGWVARAIGRVVEVTGVPDRERAPSSQPLMR